ncbi:MAG: Ig-like domain-containing protein [Clostridia bacterium]|nr:Ig-like domain-containing protein [Clostridia bacterium]
MEKATEAREKDKQGTELEAIKLAVVNSIASDLTGLVNVDTLKQGLTGLVKGNLDAIIDSTKTEWEVEGNTGRLYKIANNGNVEIASTVNITKDGEIVTELSYNSDNIELNTTTIQLNATPTPDLTINSVIWESETPTVASIDNTGLVTLKDKGSTTIKLTAQTNGGDFIKTCIITIVKPIEIGDSVTYITTHNNVTLDNWKVFHKETKSGTDYTWIIYGDYLPYEAIGVGTGEGQISGLAQGNTNNNGNYCVKGTGRQELIDALTTTSNWNSLLMERKNGQTINHSSTTDINIKAIGSPTIELWTNSYNAGYTNDLLYIDYANPVSGKTYDGWYVSFESPATKTIQTLNIEAQYDKLYFPHRKAWNDCSGYWLASPSAYGDSKVVYAACGGAVGNNGNMGGSSYDSNKYSIRPVICLPSSVFE